MLKYLDATPNRPFLAMMVRGHSAARRKHLFGEAALSDTRRRPINERADLGAVSRVDDAGPVAVYYDHCCSSSFPISDFT